MRNEAPSIAELRKMGAYERGLYMNGDMKAINVQSHAVDVLIHPTVIIHAVTRDTASDLMAALKKELGELGKEYSFALGGKDCCILGVVENENLKSYRRVVQNLI